MSVFTGITRFQPDCNIKDFEMEYKFCPEWPEYALGDDGNIYSFQKGSPYIIKADKCISLHHGGKTICLKAAKFRFCCKNQIAPNKIDGRQFIITNDAVIYDQSKWQEFRNKERRKKEKQSAIARLIRTKEFAEKCIDYLMGNSTEIFTFITDCHKEMHHYLRTFTTNKDNIELILAKADEQFIDALERGKVTNPRDWYYGRCRGIIADMKKHKRRIYE